jgi:hypothetical protein
MFTVTVIPDGTMSRVTDMAGDLEDPLDQLCANRIGGHYY